MKRKYNKFNFFKSVSDFFYPLLKTFKSNSQTEILKKSLDQMAGLESELENPDAFLKKKGKNLLFYDTMMLDDGVAKAIKLKKIMALSVDGDVKPASDEEQDVKIAEYVNYIFNKKMNPNIWDTFDNMLDAMIYGYKVGEIKWELLKDNNPDWNNKYYPRTVQFRHSIFFDFEYDDYKNLKKLHIGRYHGSPSITYPESDDMNELYDKFLIFVYPYIKDGNWYGHSELIEIYTLYWARFNLFRQRNIYLNKYGQPIPEVQYVKSELSDTEYGELKDTLENFQDNMYLLVPSARNPQTGEIIPKFNLKLHEVSVAANADIFEKTIDQLDKQMGRMVLLPDRLGFSSVETGSYNSEEKRFELLLMVIEDLHGRIEDIINPFIKIIVDKNFVNVKQYPEWHFEKITEGIKQEMLAVLIDRKIIDKSEKWIRKYVKIPEITEKEQDEIDKSKKVEDEEKRKNNPFLNGAIPPQAEKEEKEEFKNPNNPPVNFKKIEQQYNTRENEFIESYQRIYMTIAGDIIDQVKRKRLIEENNTDDIKKLDFNAKDIKDLISIYYAKLYLAGKVEAIEEMSRRIPDRWRYKNSLNYLPLHFQLESEFGWLDKSWIDDYLSAYGEAGILTKADKAYLKTLRDKSFAIAGTTKQDILNSVQQVLFSGLKNGFTASTIIAKIVEQLDDESKKYAKTIARTNASDAFNSARMNQFMDNTELIEAYQFSAILDDRTTPVCEEHDGHIIYPSSPDFVRFNPPLHFNCRSLLIPIFRGESEIQGSYYYDYEKKKEEFPDWEKGVTNAGRNPSEGFGG